MDEVRLSTVVYAPREAVFAFLTDLEGYTAYSEYLKEVDRDGDGGSGTVYTMTIGWWKITYHAKSEVVAIDEPNRIDWRVVEDLDAHGHWRLEDVGDDPVAESSGVATHDDTGDATDDAPVDREHATRIELSIQFDPDSAHVGAIDVPSFVSASWVIDRVVPLVQDEARRVLRRIVADLEGAPREVELTVHEEPDSL